MLAASFNGKNFYSSQSVFYVVVWKSGASDHHIDWIFDSGA